eukprot:jgi/Botrbrau1/19071/Bobra.0788s0001.1
MAASWTELSPDLQRRILKSGVLSLPDLAKVAPCGKVFYEVYQDTFQAENAWLSEFAYKTFGQQLIDTLLQLFTCPPQKGRLGMRDRTFNLAEGEACPDMSTLLKLDYAVLLVPACGLYGPGSQSVVRCCVGKSGHGWYLKLNEESGALYLGMELPTSHPRGSLEANILFPEDWYYPAGVLPLLSVVHLACKLAAKTPHTLSQLMSAQLLGQELPIRTLDCGKMLGLQWEQALLGKPGQTVEREALRGLWVIRICNPEFWASALSLELCFKPWDRSVFAILRELFGRRT